MLWPLAIAQVISWGTLFYSFSLFAGPMGKELGWSGPATNGALTAGLLVTGAMAYPVGAWVDRFGARWLMTGGSFGAGLALLLWAKLDSLAAFYLLWLVLGALMSCVLIETAFAVIHQQFGPQARKGITAMTLVTGFSGTVFVPLIGYLLGKLGWRLSLEVLAAFNLCINVPVHFFFTPPRGHRLADARKPDPAAVRAVMQARFRNPIFWGLALWYTSYSLTSSSLIFQFVPVLSASGVPQGDLYFCFALIGPVQVLARVVALTLGRRATTAALGAMTSVIVPAGLVVLLLAPPTLPWLCVFATCFGVGHGVTTILRGLAPVEWLGREYFARTMGALAFPMQSAMAIAPLYMANVWAASGNPRVVWAAILAGSIAGAAGYLLAVLSWKRQAG